MSEGNSKINNEISEKQSENAESLSSKESTNCKDAESDNSEELFSDEETTLVNCFTPEILQPPNDCSFLNSFRTPVLFSKDITPGRAVVPSTPSSLAPFISKSNEPWTSDLETPDAKLVAKAKVSSTERTNRVQSVDRSSSNKQLTPVLENVKYENTESSSPVLNKKVRKRPKRRIFKPNTSENTEVPQNFKKQIQDKESIKNDERIHEFGISHSPDQLLTEANSPISISTLDNRKSSPKCLDNYILQADPNPDISKPSTSSVNKSLGDIVKDIKSLQKKRRLASEMNLANFSDIDLYKDAIQLESASTKFVNITKAVPVTISQAGLVPFSQFCLEIDKEPFNQERNFKNQEGKIGSRGQKDLKETAGTSKRHSKNSETVKIFNNNLKKSFEKPKESVASSVPIITLKDDEEDFIFNENIEDDLHFSQWLYESKNDEKKDAKEITDSKNSKNEDIEILAQFNNKFSKEDLDESPDVEIVKQGSAVSSKEPTIPACMEISEDVFKDIEKIEDIDLVKEFTTELLPDLEKSSSIKIVKQVSVEPSKEPTIPTCGFLTAKGKRIEISENKMRMAKSIFKDIENIEEIVVAKSSKELLAEDLRTQSNTETIKSISTEYSKDPTGFGFLTAKGKRIQISEDKLRKAKSMFKDEDFDFIIKSTKEGLPDLEKCSDTKMMRQISEESIKEPTIEDISLITEFTKDVTPQDLKKSLDTNRESNLVISKPISLDFKKKIPKAATSCGFSTAKGTSIQINNEKLRRARMIFKDIENIENVLESAAEELQVTKPNNVLEFQQKDPSKLEEKLISGFSPVKLKNPMTEIKSNSATSFSTASGKSIAISEQMLMKANQIYNEIEANDVALASTSKVHQTPPKIDFLNTNTCSMKRKLLEEDTRHAKRLRSSDVTTRNSLGLRKSFNPVIVKSISEVQVDNKVIDSNKVRDVENLPKCDLIVPEAETDQGGFVTARGKKIVISEENKLRAEKLYGNIEVEGVKTGKSVGSKRNLSLPVTFQTKNELQTKKRRSLQIQSSNVKDIQQLRKEFQQMRRDKLQNNLLIKPSSSRSENLISKYSEPESPPFCGFDIKDSTDSAALVLKSEGFLKEEMSMTFASVGGRKISINTDALSKAQLLYSSENLSNSENVGLALQKELELSELPLQLKPGTSDQKFKSKPLLKRNIDDVDGETPLGRYVAFKSKKQKITREDLQGRKLFSEDSESDDEVSKKASNKTANSEVISNATLSEDVIKGIEMLKKDLLLEDFNDARLSCKYNSEIEKEKEANSEDARRSPILVTSKKTRRRSRKMRDLVPVGKESEIKKEDKFDSDANSESRTSSQSVETESVVTNSDILERRISAAFEQDKSIARKKRQNPKSIKGSLLQNREKNRNSRISLHKFSGGFAPTTRCVQELKERGSDPDVLEISASTATSYKFQIADINSVISLEVGDGATLILNESGSAGVSEFERAFEASPGVDPRLLPPGWVENHYRWIVWKLASMDRIKLGSADIPRMLTPDRVMKDLKYRYDREIDRSQRSAIRKILEKDDVPSKTMVLCIATIKESTDNEKNEKDPRILLRTPRWKIEVTDGWYSLPASFDAAMVKKIIDGKIKEGTKIVTYGAELLNCDRGCFPLEKSVDVCLKIHTNSTRRARWYAKLGYQRRSGPIPTNLKTIDPNGGLVGKITVVVSRIYPILFREKTADGQSIYRNAKNEEKAQTCFQQAYQSKVEAIVAELQEKYEGKQNSSEEDSAESLMNCDSASYLTESQRQKLMNSRQAKAERLQQKIAQEIEAIRPTPRNVVPVQKIRVVEGETSAILTIWSKSEDVSILREGGTFSIFNTSAYGKGDGDLNLTASRQAVFKSEPNLKLLYPSRVYTPLKDVSAAGFEPPYCELDTVGIVSWIGNTPHGMKNFEAVCLSYPNEDSSSSTYLSILFWRGLSSHGFSNILTVGSLIACSNLECRRTRNALWSIPVCYSSERTVFTQNPRQPHLLEAFENLKKQISDPITYTKKCGEEISSLILKKPVSRASAQGTSNSTPISGNSGFNSPHFSMAKTPLDFDTPAKSSTIQKRIDRLASYGQPPEISPIIVTSSSNVRSNFRPVIRTPDTTKRIPPDST